MFNSMGLGLQEGSYHAMTMLLFAQFPQTSVLHGPVQAHFPPGAFILLELVLGTHTHSCITSRG